MYEQSLAPSRSSRSSSRRGRGALAGRATVTATVTGAMSVVLVVDDADGAQSRQGHRKFVENVSTAFGEFCTSWLVVPERDRGLSTVEVSVIACRAAGAALLCKATLSAADDTGRQQLAAVHRALSRLQQQSHQHGEPPAAAAGATPPPIVQALDIAHSVCRDGRASVFVASSSPRALTPAARDSLEALRGALISVRFVAAEAAAPPESGDAVPHDILGEFHNCSSTVIYNDRESWRRTMRAELRERKLTARCAPIPLLAPAAPSRRISSSHQSCTRSLLDQFANVVSWRAADALDLRSHLHAPVRPDRRVSDAALGTARSVCAVLLAVSAPRRRCSAERPR